MKAKDISLIVLGVAFVGGLGAVEVMAGLYSDRVIYTIPAPIISSHYQEIEPLDDPLEKQCREYLQKLDSQNYR